MAEALRIAIVGGGVTGLSAAHAFIGSAREVGREVTVNVLESSNRFGGVLTTERVDGFVLDAGPDSWVASKPHATALARELGLGAALMGTRPETRRFFVPWGSRLHAVPEGLVLGIPTRMTPLFGSRLFTWRGKLRMALEPLVPARRYAGDEDESIAQFASRRLGREAADRLVAPLLGGISAGDASQLSIRAAFPQLVAMERDHGSLVWGMLRTLRARAVGDRTGKDQPQSSGPFVSLEGGVGVLIDALAARLMVAGAALRTGARVRGLARAPGGRWLLQVEGAPSIEADAVLLAVPGHEAARVLVGLDEPLSGLFGALHYGSTVTVFLAYRRADVAHPLDGVGFIVPQALGRDVLASTWVSSKWAHRAPEGHVLLRAFLGGVERDGSLARPDAELAMLARNDLRDLMGVDAEPLWSRVFRFDRASAQMHVGHLVAMRAIRERLAVVAPRVAVAGGGYGGIGIPDCIREGQESARAMLEEMA